MSWSLWLALAIGVLVLTFAVGLATSFLINELNKHVNLPRPQVYKGLAVAAVCGLVLAAGTFLLSINQPSRDTLIESEPDPGWPLIASSSYDEPDGPLVDDLQDGCNTASARRESRQLLIRLTSCRDYTYQLGITPTPPVFDAPFLFRADVQFVSGPNDAYCTLLFNWEDSEHWYAFKLSRETFQITRNSGVLPHALMDGPRTHPAINSEAMNRLTVFKQGLRAKFFINRVEVAEQEVSSATAEVRLGAQAATRSDVVRCAFDNVNLRTG